MKKLFFAAILFIGNSSFSAETNPALLVKSIYNQAADQYAQASHLEDKYGSCGHPYFRVMFQKYSDALEMVSEALVVGEQALFDNPDRNTKRSLELLVGKKVASGYAFEGSLDSIRRTYLKKLQELGEKCK